VDAFSLWLVLAFFVVAVLYSTAGFGGGSSYLALLFLAGISYTTIPKIALTCNLLVASSAFFHYYRGGHFQIKKVLPFVVLSIPLAFLGGSIVISKEGFCFLLGMSLLAASLRLFMSDPNPTDTSQLSLKQAWMVGVPIGGALGFLSGLVGIGGGIFLSPLLVLMRWSRLKEASATASLFIIVNSLSGLFGQLSKGSFNMEPLLYLGAAVFLGGQIGSRIGSFHLPRLKLQRVLAGLMLLVSIRMLTVLL